LPACPHASSVVVNASRVVRHKPCAIAN